MIDQNAFELEMLNHEDESTSNDDMINGSDEICITELVETSMNDARNSKNTLVLRMESVINLMKEVECEEKFADEAKKEADQSSLDILVKLGECRRTLRDAEELNDTLVRKLYVNKAVLATNAETFQLRMSHLLDHVDTLSEVFDEVSRSLKMRLNSAILKKEASLKKKQENEAFAEAALAFEKLQMEKVEEESRSLKQEAVETFKLLELLMDHDHELDKLQREIADNYQNVKQLKQQLDQGNPLGVILSILTASVSSFKLFDGNTNIVHEIISDNLQSKDADVNKLSKTTKKAKPNTKLRRKRVKIKGLQVIWKKTAIADEGWDSFSSEVVALRLLLFMVIAVFVLQVFGFHVIV